MITNISALTAMVAAFLLSCIAIVLLRPVCLRFGHVDKPGGHKRHSLATPLSGGIAISTCIIALGFGVMPSWRFTGFAFGSIVLLILGGMDDRKHVPAPIRMALQAIAVAGGMYFIGGVRLENLGAIFGSYDIVLGPYAFVFTLFAAVGVINAVNMIDGMDGLAGGFAVQVVALILALGSGANTVNVILLCLTIGSVMAFLMFNLRTPWQRQARIFLGDAGSLVLGYMLVWFAVEASQGPRAILDPITAVWLFGLPLSDTVYLMVSRIARGRSPLTADCYHFHHLLQGYGLSPGWALYVWLSVAGGFMTFAVVGQFVGLSEVARCLYFLLAFTFYCALVNWAWRRLGKRERRVLARTHSS